MRSQRHLRFGMAPKQQVLATVSALSLAALAGPQPANAQTVAQATTAQTANTQTGAQATTAQNAQTSGLEEVTVTGSRIVRNGYQAPTPVTVVTADQLQASANVSIADTVNQMPEFADATTPHNQATTISTGTSGINDLNLRGLGPNRTLVLLDGMRTVGTTLSGFGNQGGTVDINSFPAGLVSRIDVVTGGASADYGSDALAGVVNFVLDHNFTGIKGEVEGGITTYGDDANYKVNFTAGTPFADGRGHFLFFGEDTDTAGITGNPRPWEAIGAGYIVNPAYTKTNGQPQYTDVRNMGLATATPGGLITSGPLKGTAFGPGGAPYQLQYGSIVSGNEMVGGDWESTKIDTIPDLDLALETQNAFTRISYNLADNFELYSDLQYSFTRTDNGQSVPNFHLGNLSVAANNPYLPASVAAAAAANGVTSMTFGSTLADVGSIQALTYRTLQRYVYGADGKFNVFNTDWSWNAYYQRGETSVQAYAPNAVIEANLRQAIDSVVNPATGSIVCANPSGGCVPFDPFGTGVNTQKALNYVTGTGYALTILTEDDGELNLSGSPFSSWAGPVSLAAGGEWRKEAVGGLVNAQSNANAFFAGNYHPTAGSFNVTEGYLETVVPLATNIFLAKSLDLNAAARATDYSVSGYVTTWKVGVTYQPTSDVSFRYTRSRDIRAPNLGDLYNVGPAAPSTYFDPEKGNQPELIYGALEGNLNLKPEIANTTGAGIVFTPTFVPGFGVSFDYYNINITGAIESPSVQQIIDDCYNGSEPALCPFITRAPTVGGVLGNITNIAEEGANIASQDEQGYDIEASYRLPMSYLNNDWMGDIAFRLLATHILTLTQVNLGSTTNGTCVNSGGSVFGTSALYAPCWRYSASAAYERNPITVTLTMRGVGAGVLDNTIIVCSAGCPTSTVAAPTGNYNYVSPWQVFDLAFDYKLPVGTSNMDVYATVQDLTNRNPPIIPGTTENGYYSGQDVETTYDTLGRNFHFGIRFKL